MKMRSLFLCLLSVLVTAEPSRAGGTTQIEFPLTVTELIAHKVVAVPMSSLNLDLSAHQMEKFPERAVFGKKDRALAKAIQERLDNVGKTLQRKLYLYSYGTLGYYLHHVPQPFCYRGKASEVLTVIRALMGVVFNENEGFLGVRYGKTKKFLTHEQDFGQRSDQEAAVWDNYDTTSNAVLLMSDLGPEGDGTELYSLLIPSCQ